MARQEKGNWNPYNSKAIIHNIELIFSTGNIEKLNNPTYHFVYLLSGFIANYNLHGFQETYRDLRLFAKDLLDACGENEERRNLESWFVQEYGKAYCQSKADTIRGIRETVKKYQGKINQEFESGDIQKLKNLYNIIGEVLKRGDPEIIQTLVHQLELK